MTTLSGVSPIFVTGLDHSGRHILAGLLGSHPNIAMTCGLNVWPRFGGDLADLSAPEDLSRCISVLRDHQLIRALGVDLDLVRENFLDAGERTYARLLALIGLQHAHRRHKSRWADTSPAIEHHASELLADFPDARILHVVRDPRDHLASTRAGTGHGRTAGRDTAKWLRSVRVARDLAARDPDHYRAVRYEDVMNDPGAVLQFICSFIAEEYTPSMFALQGTQRSCVCGLWPPEASEGPVGRYLERLTSTQIAVIERMAATDMAAAGYELVSPQLTSLRNLWFAIVRLPMEVAMARAWSWGDAMRRRRGSLRSPTQRAPA